MHDHVAPARALLVIILVSGCVFEPRGLGPALVETTPPAGPTGAPPTSGPAAVPAPALTAKSDAGPPVPGAPDARVRDVGATADTRAVEAMADAGAPDLATDAAADAAPAPGVPTPRFQPPATPLLWLRFDEPPGTAHPRDDSGHGHRVTLYNLETPRAWVRGRQGGAIDLGADGRNGYARVEPLPGRDVFEAGFSVATWLRRPLRNDPGAVLSRRPRQGGPALYALVIKHARVRAELRSGVVLRSPEVIPTERWVHVAFTYDRRTARLYIDGAEVASQAHDQPLGHDDDAPLLIGAHPADPGEARPARDFLPDKLDDFALYARALAPREILRLMRLRSDAADSP